MVGKSENSRLAAMAAWRDYYGNIPFGEASSRFASDRCNKALGSAVAILSMLSVASEDAAALGEQSQFNNTSGIVMAGALDGVSTLINLAAFMMGGE